MKIIGRTARLVALSAAAIAGSAAAAPSQPTAVELAQRSRSRDLDRAALAAVRGWTFEPALRDGKPVASTVQVPVDFRLATQ